jgi:hypothetical protein
MTAISVCAPQSITITTTGEFPFVSRHGSEHSPCLQKAVLSFCNRLLVETTYTVLANGQNKVEERLSRWLLLADDRIDSNVLPLTHEFLSTTFFSPRLLISPLNSFCSISAVTNWSCRSPALRGEA